MLQASELPDARLGVAELNGTPNDFVLKIEDLHTVFHTRKSVIHAVNSVSFSVKSGELLGVVGESGSGKSVTMLSFLGLLPTPPAEIRSGRALFNDRDLLTASPNELREIRGGKIGFIFQDPMTSLNPVFTVGFQVAEPLRRHLGMSRRAAKKRAADLLELVGIPDPHRRLGDFPHQFSGGMRQRVMIAIALACDPVLLIADEPTTALDVTIQAQILELIQRLQNQLGMSIIWITHDLGVIASIANRVLVMYGGKIVEQAPVEELFSNSQHPYTRALLGTVPSIRGKRAQRLQTIAGQAPTLNSIPETCSFWPRCDFALDRCKREAPEMVRHSRSHAASCFLMQQQT